MAYTREEFIGLISEACVANAIKSKILPSLMITHAILESDDGNSRLATEANNLFGIKACPFWHGPTVMLPAKQNTNGKTDSTDILWRAYPDWAASIEDYGVYMTSHPIYSKIIGETNYEKACLYLHDAGYEIDTKQLIHIIESNQLYLFDSMAEMKIDHVEQYPGCLH